MQSKKLGLSDSGVTAHCTQRAACEFTLNTNARKWPFSGLGCCLGGSNVDEHKVTKGRTSNPSLVPEPKLWMECQHMHRNKVLCCQHGCTSALFSHANQSPRDCCRDLPHHAETNWVHENMGKEKELSISWDRRGWNSLAVSALGGQWIQFSAPEWNEAKLVRNKHHTMEHCCWDIQETEQGLKLTD